MSSVSPACRKRRLNVVVSQNNRIKRLAPNRCLDGHVKEPTKCLLHWEPDHRSNFFFSPPAHQHVCAVTLYDWNTVDCDVWQPIHHHLTCNTFLYLCSFAEEGLISKRRIRSIMFIQFDSDSASVLFVLYFFIKMLNTHLGRSRLLINSYI